MLQRKWTNGMLRLFVWFLLLAAPSLADLQPHLLLLPPSHLPQPLTTWMTYDVETVHLHAEHRGAPPTPTPTLP